MGNISRRVDQNVDRRGLGVSARRLGAVGALGAAMVLGGCNNALEGGLSGAGLGALGGMGIGAMSGNMGEGAAIGAIVGGIGGLILGDQNARHGGSYHRNHCD